MQGGSQGARAGAPRGGRAGWRPSGSRRPDVWARRCPAAVVFLRELRQLGAPRKPPASLHARCSPLASRACAAHAGGPSLGDCPAGGLRGRSAGLLKASAPPLTHSAGAAASQPFQGGRGDAAAGAACSGWSRSGPDPCRRPKPRTSPDWPEPGAGEVRAGKAKRSPSSTSRGSRLGAAGPAPRSDCVPPDSYAEILPLEGWC